MKDNMQSILWKVQEGANIGMWIGGVDIDRLQHGSPDSDDCFLTAGRLRGAGWREPFPGRKKEMMKINIFFLVEV